MTYAVAIMVVSSEHKNLRSFMKRRTRQALKLRSVNERNFKVRSRPLSEA